tara:strand:+ start:140 stop:664 length:525 start_codon:yes stop_codon:yes gene_type:complete
MRLSSLLLFIGLILLTTAFFALSEEAPQSFTLLRFELDPNNLPPDPTTTVNSFTVGEGPSLPKPVSSEQRIEIRKRNLNNILKEQYIEDCLDEISKNWVRTFASKSLVREFDENGKELSREEFYETDSVISGFKDEEDFRLKWRTRNKVVNGEKVCKDITYYKEFSYTPHDPYE